jgi:hypothetical protein
MVEFSCRDILFELPIPSVFIMVANERDQPGELLRRESIDRSFDFGQTRE